MGLVKMNGARIFYHGLPKEHLDLVLLSGLKVAYAKGHRKVVYLASCRKTAENYCYMHNIDPENWSVIGVDERSLESTCVSLDDTELKGLVDCSEVDDLDQFEVWRRAPSWVTLDISSQIAYSRDIPPEAISLVSDCMEDLAVM